MWYFAGDTVDTEEIDNAIQKISEGAAIFHPKAQALLPLPIYTLSLMLRLVIGFLFPPIPHVNRFAIWAQAAPKAFRINSNK